MLVFPSNIIGFYDVYVPFSEYSWNCFRKVFSLFFFFFDKRKVFSLIGQCFQRPLASIFNRNIFVELD